MPDLNHPITYRIRPIDVHAHLFEVELEVDKPDPAGQRFALPAWIPGSYLVREFARNIVSIDARCRSKPIALSKLDKHTWRAQPCRSRLRLRYRVYAWDLSVRGAHLDATHGFFNGTSVFLRVLGQEWLPCVVHIDPPSGKAFADWRLATTLPEDGAKRWGFGRYRACDYDELIDHPVEMGRFTTASFEAAGARHDVVVTGVHDADMDRLCADLGPICAAQAALFEPKTRRAPFDRYLFLVMAIGDGYGGLEHRSSTALLCRRNELPYVAMKGVPDGYRSFLALASHEYFHAWHIKRIKPAAFVAYDLDGENYTRLLWVFEGFTSYYDDLMLARASVIAEAAYLKQLGTTLSSVLRGPGRFGQSVAESSFDAWTKYYRQDENAPNAIVSYYAKGALVALALDLHIRAKTRGKRSLDDVMRLAWRRYGRDFYALPPQQRAGLDEEGFAALAESATGLDLRQPLALWVDGVDDPPLDALLHPFGVELTLKAPDQVGAVFGARLKLVDGTLQFQQVLHGGTAHAAGLSAGDALVAIDGLRIADERALKALLERHHEGDRLRVHAFRRDELFEVMLQVGVAAPCEAQLAPIKRESKTMRALRRGWIGARRRAAH